MNVNQYKIKINDECYTFTNLVKITLPFLKEFENKLGRRLIIWCPFDLTEDIEIEGQKYFRSNYVDIFEKEGHKVIASHILTGQDFFEYEPEEDWDIIISNPPFVNKKAFFERALSFNKPFALVAPMSWLNDGAPNKLFDFDDFSMIIPNRRAKFFNENGVIGKQPSFKAGYFCKGFTNKQINFVEMEKEKLNE